MSVILAEGVHVLRRGTGSTFDDILIPGTTAANAPVSPTVSCGYALCTTVPQMGEFASSAALAAATDGTLWLVTIRDHLDRSIPYKYDGGEACQCRATLVPADDHSTGRWPFSESRSDRQRPRRFFGARLSPSSRSWIQPRPSPSTLSRTS